MKSIILTTVQFTAIGIILFTNRWLADSPFLVLIQLSGVLLGAWAILVMSRSKLNITPVPRKGATLVTSGPYRWIRHPMYTSLILALYPILYRDHGPLNLAVFSILLVNLILKLSYEERLLRQRFDGYDKMTAKTWRLIPWIY